MNKLSRVLAGTCVFLFATAVATPSHAGTPYFSIPAQVERIAMHHQDHTGIDWVSLVGVTTVGPCAQFQGKVIFSIPRTSQGQKQLTMLNTALVSGRNVVVHVDDALKDTGGGPIAFCRIVGVELRR